MGRVPLSVFGKYPVWVRPQLRGKFTAVAALVELVCLMDYKTCRVRISHERLGQRMGCSTRTARRAIEVLVNAGAILRSSTNYSSNVYTVQMEGVVMDWEEWSTLGEDSEKVEVPVTKGRIPRLLAFFTSEIEMHIPMSIQSPVNAKAMSRHFKEMLDTHGVTERQIKTMITLFAIDLERGDRTVEDVPPWQMFLSDRQALLKRVMEGNEDIVYVDEMYPAD
jgi:DNA-binding Lrp family transcriptional regulator